MLRSAKAVSSFTGPWGLTMHQPSSRLTLSNGTGLIIYRARDPPGADPTSRVIRALCNVFVKRNMRLGPGCRMDLACWQVCRTACSLPV